MREGDSANGIRGYIGLYVTGISQSRGKAGVRMARIRSGKRCTSPLFLQVISLWPLRGRDLRVESVLLRSNRRSGKRCTSPLFLQVRALFGPWPRARYLRVERVLQPSKRRDLLARSTSPLFLQIRALFGPCLRGRYARAAPLLLRSKRAYDVPSPVWRSLALCRDDTH